VKRLVLQCVRACILLGSGISIASAEEIKIGAVASLQGGASEQGRSWVEGAQLAVEELNAAGEKVKLIVEDDQTQPAKAATAYTKLVKRDRVSALIGGTWDFLGEVLYPLALRDSVPILTPSNPKEILSEGAKLNRFVFTNGISIGAEELALEGFLKSRKFASAAIVSVQVPFALAHAEMARRVFARNSIKLTHDIEFSLEELLTSYKVGAQKVYRKKVDLIYVVSDYNGLDQFAAELQNLKWAPIVVTTQHLDGAYELSRGNDERYKNIFGIYPVYDRSEFDSTYQKRFQRKPKVFAAEGYDGARFLVAALRAGAFQSGQTFNWLGLKGNYQLPSSDRALLRDKAQVVQMRNGELVPEL